MGKERFTRKIKPVALFEYLIKTYTNEGTYKIKKYKRGDKELYLCSCCNILGDIEIKAETNK